MKSLLSSCFSGLFLRLCQSFQSQRQVHISWYICSLAFSVSCCGTCHQYHIVAYFLCRLRPNTRPSQWYQILRYLVQMQHKYKYGIWEQLRWVHFCTAHQKNQVGKKGICKNTLGFHRELIECIRKCRIPYSKMLKLLAYMQ